MVSITLAGGTKEGEEKEEEFTISGVTAAFARVILAGRLNSGQPRSAAGFELEVIAATIIGVLLMGVMANGLIIMDVDSFWQHVVRGVILIIAVYFDQKRKEKA